jgi:hypothetical protein
MTRPPMAIATAPAVHVRDAERHAHAGVAHQHLEPTALEVGDRGRRPPTAVGHRDRRLHRGHPAEPSRGRC